MGHRRDVACGAVLVILATALLWRALLPGNVLLPLQLTSLILPWSNTIHEPLQNGLISDPFFAFYPRRSFFATAVRAGQQPFWNPYMLGGYPAVGDINAQTFYPPNWAAALLASPARSFAILAWFHLGLTGVLMYGFLRSIRLRRLAALLGGIAWMLNGVTVVWLENPHRLSSAAWLPGVFWLFELAVRCRRLAPAAGGGLLFGLMMLGGQPQYTALGGLYLAGYALAKALGRRNGRLRWAWHPVVILAIIAVLGLMLGALQLLPAYEFTLHSQREVRPLERWLRQCWPLRHTVTLWVPDFYGTPVPGRYPYWGTLNYAEFTYYFGVIPFFLAVGTPLLRRTSTSCLLAALAGLTLLFAWGTPLTFFARWIPGMAYFGLRRMLSLLPFLGAWLAALALDTILRRRGSIRTALAVTVMLVLLTAVVLYAERMEVRVHWDGVWPDLLRTGLILGVGLAILVLARRWPRLAAGGLVLLTCLDLFQWGLPFNPVAPERLLYPEGSLMERLREESDHFRVLPLQRRSHMFDVFGPNILSLYHLSEPTGYCAQLIRNHKELLYTIDPFHVDRPDLLSGPHPNLVISRNFCPLHSLLSVRFVLSSEELSADETGLRLLDVQEGIYLYENLAAMPRAYFVRQVQVAGPEGTLAMLRDDSFDFSEAVILESPLPPGEMAALEALHVQSNASVQIILHEPLRIELEVETEHPGLVVLTDPYYPGWRATVAGENAAIYRVNHDLRAVFVPAGSSTVAYEFRPTSVVIGALCAFAGVLSAGFIWLWERHRLSRT
jgi:hypothetical protein